MAPKKRKTSKARVLTTRSNKTLNSSNNSSNSRPPSPQVFVGRARTLGTLMNSNNPPLPPRSLFNRVRNMWRRPTAGNATPPAAVETARFATPSPPRRSARLELLRQAASNTAVGNYVIRRTPSNEESTVQQPRRPGRNTPPSSPGSRSQSNTNNTIIRRRLFGTADPKIVREGHRLQRYLPVTLARELYQRLMNRLPTSQRARLSIRLTGLSVFAALMYLFRHHFQEMYMILQQILGMPNSTNAIRGKRRNGNGNGGGGGGGTGDVCHPWFGHMDRYTHCYPSNWDFDI